MEDKKPKNTNLEILKKKVDKKTTIFISSSLTASLAVYEYFISDLMPSFENAFISILFTLFIIFCLFALIVFLGWVVSIYTKIEKTAKETREDVDKLINKQDEKRADIISEKISGINKEKKLNPDIEVCECKSKYRQISKFEYENNYFLKIKTKKVGLCNYIMRYLWEGSEQDYSVEAFEDEDIEEKKIGIIEIPSVSESGVRTFATILNFNKKDDIKYLIVKFKKLKDTQGLAKKESFYEPSSDCCGRITIEVFLLENKLFYKKVVDTNFDLPREQLKKILSHRLSKSCSWSVHDDKDINKIIEKEKYIIYWK